MFLPLIYPYVALYSSLLTLGTESKIKTKLSQTDVMMESAWQVSQPKEVQHLPLDMCKVLHARISIPLTVFLCAGYLCGCSIQNERISVKRETWMSNYNPIRKCHKYFLIQYAWGQGSIYLVLMEKDNIFSRFFTLKSIEVGIDPPWGRYGRNHCDVGSYKLLRLWVNKAILRRWVFCQTLICNEFFGCIWW